MPLELDVLTMNLWGLPWPVSRERRARKRRFAAHLAATAYDLVGIQELWWPWRSALSELPLHLPASRRDSGLALAARLQVREPARVDAFAEHRGPERLKRKGVLRAHVEAVQGVSLCVSVTHLQSGSGQRNAGIRARQIEQILRLLSGERAPAVLMGDFNLHAGNPEDRRSDERLRSAGFVDAASALSCEEPTYHPSNPYVRCAGPAQRFDRIYLRDGDGVRLEATAVEVVDTQPRPLSDHHPLRARVRLSG